MTDRVDEMLTAAGEQWRAAQPPPPEPDPRRWPVPAGNRGAVPARNRKAMSARGREAVPAGRRWAWPAGLRRRWSPVVAAAGATAVVAAGLSVAALRTSDGDRTASIEAATATADLVVHEGDRVEATGTLLAAPGQVTRLCPPKVTTGVEADRPACAHVITVTGAEAAGGGFATIRGVWRAGGIQVESQQVADPRAGGGDDSEVPCAAPGGGWRGASGVDRTALHAYVADQHPEEFGPPWLGRAAGSAPGSATSVLVVPVVEGDLAAARRELAERYRGNLCLVHAPAAVTIAGQTAAIAAARPAVDRLMADDSLGVYGFGHPTDLSLDLVVLTPAIARRIEAAEARARSNGLNPLPVDDLTGLEPHPWVRPDR